MKAQLVRDDLQIQIMHVASLPYNFWSSYEYLIQYQCEDPPAH